MLKITLFVLAAIWLPVTQHCALEAAGVFSDSHHEHAQKECCSNSNPKCADDSCPLIEDGDYLPPDAVLVQVEPMLELELWTLALRDLLAFLRERPLNVEAPSESFERPRDCAELWQFEHRAACPPRAPSLALA